MPKAGTVVKQVAFVAIGVLVAGLIMSMGKSIPGVKQAQNGFQGII